LVPEGTTVEINTVVARIGAAGEAKGSAPAAKGAPAAAPAAKPAAAPRPEPQASKPAPPQPSAPPARPAPAPASARGGAARDSSAESAAWSSAQPATRSLAGPAAPRAAHSAGGVETLEELRRRRSSPLVRRIAREQGIDLTDVAGSGVSGRVTKQDIEAFLESAAHGADSLTTVRPRDAATPAGPTAADLLFAPGEEEHVEPMSVMRRKIAEHMTMSRRTSAHVTTFFEVDMLNVTEIRERLKGDFLARDGVKLTYLPFVLKAITNGLRAHPTLNASVTENFEIVYKRAINIGVAVALEGPAGGGLIVPVIKNAEEKNLLGLARALNDLGERARSKKLKPDEVQGGTFSVTNPGVFGSLMGTPIINQPQVAILGVGAIVKRAVVIDDAIAIRPMVYLSISYDHRLVDGASADKFMLDVKKVLETSDFGDGR
jgi:2-oxoglutarate dehydrogenase E2 component (dihydrolipoamide succinyltransferase)